MTQINITSAPNLETLRQTTGSHFRHDLREPWWGKITALNAGGAYSAKEQEPASGGTFIDLDKGRTTDLAYEENGNLNVPIGTIVRLRIAVLNHGPTLATQEYSFEHCCS